MSKKVYIAYTGGTIGMQQVNGRYQPIPNFLQRLMADNPAFHHPELPQFTINQYDPLLDSPNMTPGDWSHIATQEQITLWSSRLVQGAETLDDVFRS